MGQKKTALEAFLFKFMTDPKQIKKLTPEARQRLQFEQFQVLTDQKKAT